MSSESIRRTTYTDPTDGDSVRLGPTSHGESLVDQSRYERPLERVHGSGVHGWGIGSGLAITATINQPGVAVLPGIALDVAGRHLSLALGAKAEVGPNANNPGVAPNLVDVLATGAVMPTTGLTGSFYVTLTWRESFDVDLWNASGQSIFEMLHTPWIRLELAANITDATDDGSRIVLGRVTIAAGNVTALTHERRREVSVPAGSVEFRRGDTALPPALKADNVASGEIRARAAGGLEVKVATATDQVDFRRDGGNIAKVSFGADHLTVRRTDGRESLVFDTQFANLWVGTQGVPGEVLVKDGSNRMVITLDGDDAALVVGAAGNEGDILVKDNGGQDSMRVDGNTGDITFRGRLRDPAGSHGGIGHGSLRHLPELTAGGFTSLHKHLNSGNAARARSVRLFSSGNATATADITFPSARQLTAFIAVAFLDPLDSFDRADMVAAEIYRIDGNDFRAGGFLFDGDHLGPDGADSNCRAPVFVGTARTVTFRLRSFINAASFALCVVFPE